MESATGSSRPRPACHRCHGQRVRGGWANCRIQKFTVDARSSAGAAKDSGRAAGYRRCSHDATGNVYADGKTTASRSSRKRHVPHQVGSQGRRWAVPVPDWCRHRRHGQRVCVTDGITPRIRCPRRVRRRRGRDVRRLKSDIGARPGRTSRPGTIEPPAAALPATGTSSGVHLARLLRATGAVYCASRSPRLSVGVLATASRLLIPRPGQPRPGTQTPTVPSWLWR